MGESEDLFESPRFHIADIKDKLSEIDSICQSCIDDKGYGVRIDLDAKTGQNVHRVVADWQFPAKVRSLTADAICGLRHTLDQATCAAYEALTGAVAPKNLYFPIVNDESDLLGRFKKQSFPKELCDAILPFEPYPPKLNGRRGNAVLCGLSKAAQNKHRVTCKVGVGLAGVTYRNFTYGDTDKPISIVLGPNLKGDSMAFATTGPDDALSYDMQAFLFPALDNAGPITGHHAVRFINSALDLTRLVVDRFESVVAATLVDAS